MSSNQPAARPRPAWNESLNLLQAEKLPEIRAVAQKWFEETWVKSSKANESLLHPHNVSILHADLSIAFLSYSDNAFSSNSSSSDAQGKLMDRDSELGFSFTFSSLLLTDCHHFYLSCDRICWNISYSSTSSSTHRVCSETCLIAGSFFNSLTASRPSFVCWAEFVVFLYQEPFGYK